MDNKQKVTTGKVRFSYANIWKPKSINGGEEKYSVSLIIPKSDKDTIRKINEAVEEAKKAGAEKFGQKFLSGNLKLPLRDGDTDRVDDENYENAYFVNANSTTAPGIINRQKEEILDQTEVYSGCYGRASVTFYPFNTNGNKGIACGLNHLQKLADGEPLSGRGRAEDDFDDLPYDEDDDLLS